MPPAPPQDDITPKKPSPYHFASTGNSAEVRKELRPELLGKVNYDDSSVFRRIFASGVDGDFVTKCHGMYHTDLEEDLNLLLSVTASGNRTAVHAQAASRTVEKLANDNKRKAEEKVSTRLERSMYGPLVRVSWFCASLQRTYPRTSSL